MDLTTWIIVVAWLSGAAGLWASIAQQQKEPLGWTHFVAAIFGLYWPAIVPGILVYRTLNFTAMGSEET